MKTKNNVQKTFLRTIAVITSFVLLSLTVTAQGYWKQLLTNNSFNRIASALVENKATLKETAKNDVESDEFCDFYFDKGSELILAEPIMVEANFNMNLMEITEPGLTIENWMMDSGFTGLDEIEDQPLVLEDWMM